MIPLTTRSLFAVMLAAGFCQAANPVIGMVVTKGEFRLDNARVWGNATLFEGSSVQTQDVPTRLQLPEGARMRLAAGSRATVHRERAVLEGGMGQLEDSGKYALEARTLQIVAAAPHTVARVQLAGASQVIVAAMGGAVRVTNAEGILLASMEPGRELAFDPQAGAAAPTTVTGCLLRKNGKYVIVDQTTNVMLEVEGTGLARELGNRVKATGAEEGQILRVIELKVVGKGGCAGVAKQVGAIGAAAGAGIAGLSTGATVAIIGGVAVGATVGGLAATGSAPFSGAESRSSISR